MASKPFISQLIDDLASDSVSLTECLRKARIAAARLKLDTISQWIDLELKGYSDTADLPPYRMKQGLLQGHNPYHGWQPIQSEDRDFIEKISRAPIGSPIGIVENDARSKPEHLEFGLPAATRNALSQCLDFPTSVRLWLSPNTPLEILEAVRNLLIDWCLELERSGVTGEGLTFGDAEQRAAPAATDRFVVHNYGSIGNVIGQAEKSTVRGYAYASEQLARLRAVAEQIANAEDLLPDDIRSEVAATNAKLADELAKDVPNPDYITELVGSLRKVAESASGSLTAQGILALLRGILGG